MIDYLIWLLGLIQTVRSTQIIQIATTNTVMRRLLSFAAASFLLRTLGGWKTVLFLMILGKLTTTQKQFVVTGAESVYPIDTQHPYYYINYRLVEIFISVLVHVWGTRTLQVHFLNVWTLMNIKQKQTKSLNYVRN